MSTPGGTDFEKLIHALLSDHTLRNLLASHPAEMLKRVGIEPTAERISALEAVSPGLVERVARAFGDSYCEKGAG